MEHKKRFLVFLLSGLVFMTAKTAAVVEDIKTSFKELEVFIEEKALEEASVKKAGALENIIISQEIDSNVKEDFSKDKPLAIGPEYQKTLLPPLEKKDNNKARVKDFELTYKEVISYEDINFNKVYKNDPTIDLGKSKVESSGSLGQREIITKVTLKDKVEVSRKVISNKVLISPKDEVVLKGTYVKEEKENKILSLNSTGLEALMVSEINTSRSDFGVAGLRDDSRLRAAAQIRVLEIVDNFSHTRPGGLKFSTVDKDWVNGENIAYGRADVSLTHSRFMASASHKENILRSCFKSVGVASHRLDNGVIYWVVLFGAK